MQSGRTPLHIAAAKANLETVRVLLDAGADVHAVDAEGYTPMIGAIGIVSYEKVIMLHEKGAAINVHNKKNFVTSLMAAVTGEHIPLVKLCLENGCNVDDKDKVLLFQNGFR